MSKGDKKMKTQQHLIRVWTIVSQYLYSVRLSLVALSIIMFVLVAGLSLLSVFALHLPLLHMLSTTLQSFNKIPFGEPWPQ